MKRNVGNTDKIVSLLLVAAIVGVGIFYKSWWALLAMVPLATDIISFCSLYKILEINSCSTQSVE